MSNLTVCVYSVYLVFCTYLCCCSVANKVYRIDIDSDIDIVEFLRLSNELTWVRFIYLQ